MLLSLTLAALAPQGPGPSTAPIVINEFAYDDASTDNFEFVELWNRTAATIDISGWVVQNEEGSTGTAASQINPSFTFPIGTTIAPGQYIVVGNAAVPNVTHVVAANFLENGPDGITLRDASLNVVDGVVYRYALWNNPAPAWLEGALRGATITTEAGANTPPFGGSTVSHQRKVDGYDSNNNAVDFVYTTWTPGTANGSADPLLLGYSENFDAPAGTMLPDFASSFRAAATMDPTAVLNSDNGTATLPTFVSVPASPQGGNLCVMNDPTGGGNMHAVRQTVGTDFLVECYVYVSGGNVAWAATEGQSWGMGVGTSDGYGSPIDVPGTYYATTSGCAGAGNREPGATGIAWLAFDTATQTQLYLVDLNDTTAPFTILAGPIVATPGSNDGWQRLRIRAQGTSIVANFGGTYACDDGLRFTATVGSRIEGQPYFRFRECIAANANVLPLMIDRLEVFGTQTFVSVASGTGSPSSGGVPTIASSGGDPVIGNLGWGVSSSNWPAFTAGGLVITVGTLNGGVQLPGGQPGALLYVGLPETLLFVAPSDAGGNANQVVGIPCSNAFAGIEAGAQWLVYDPSLPYSLAFATSPGLQLQIGN